MPEAGDCLIPPRDNRAMFDGLAGRYDLLNRLLSLGLHRSWRRRTVRLLAPRPGGLYLDLGTGTADLALEILAQAPGCRVLGLDPARGMLRRGAAKVRAAGRGAEAWLAAGDALRLPLAARSCDGLASAFCLRNFADRAGAFREMARVVRPGGAVACLDLTEPRRALPRLLHRAGNRLWAPLLGGLLSRGPAYAYLAASIRAFPPPERILAEMRAAGLERVEARPMTGGIVTVFRAAACPPDPTPAA